MSDLTALEELNVALELGLLEDFMMLLGEDIIPENEPIFAPRRVLRITRAQLRNGTRIAYWLRNRTLAAMNSLIDNQNDRWQICQELTDTFRSNE